MWDGLKQSNGAKNVLRHVENMNFLWLVRVLTNLIQSLGVFCEAWYHISVIYFRNGEQNKCFAVDSTTIWVTWAQLTPTLQLR